MQRDRRRQPKNFLPQLASSLSIRGFPRPGKGLDLETNKKFSGVTMQFQALSQQPQVPDALVANIPQKLRSAAKDSIAKTLGHLDNVSATLAANVESRFFGRWSSNNAQWISTLTSQVIGDRDNAARAADEVLERVSSTGCRAAGDH